MTTPATFQHDRVTGGDGSTWNYPVATGLVVGVADMPPLTIGCLDTAGSQIRFSWRENVPTPNERAADVVSGGDWLTLVEKFGLTAHLEDGVTR
jgi:hypothetical protein